MKTVQAVVSGPGDIDEAYTDFGRYSSICKRTDGGSLVWAIFPSMKCATVGRQCRKFQGLPRTNRRSIDAYPMFVDGQGVFQELPG